MMKYCSVLLVAFMLIEKSLPAQQNIDSLFPVRGFCIGAPKPQAVDSFTRFIVEELAPRKVNTLILRVDYRYQYKSHPELIDSFALKHSGYKKNGQCLQKK